MNSTTEHTILIEIKNLAESIVILRNEYQVINIKLSSISKELVEITEDISKIKQNIIKMESK